MKVMFVIREPYLPDVVGGGVLDIDELSRYLTRLHHVVLLCCTHLPDNTTRGKVLRRLRLDPRRPLRQSFNGYQVVRTGRRALLSEVERQLQGGKFEPDAVIFQGANFMDLVPMILRNGAPVIVRIVTLESADEIYGLMQADPAIKRCATDPRVCFLSNSQFVADYVQNLLGVESPVSYPCVDQTRVAASFRSPDHVTFVNPSRVKGLTVALKVAQLLPHRQFKFLRAWPLSPAQQADLEGELALLPNVRLEGPTANMSEVYAHTSLLLVPSQWREAFGRVALEAAANGIPQVVSNVGGLPEAVGGGGVFLEPHADPRIWADAVEQILTNTELYASLSVAGLEHACSSHFAPQRASDDLLDVVRRLREVGGVPPVRS